MAGGSPPSALPGAEAVRAPDESPPPVSGSPSWLLPGGALSLERPRIMGIVNLTPDSFSDGGELRSVEDAVLRAESMVAEGAEILDVGGESTRPGAREVPADVEMRRILPFLRAASDRLPVPISVDTRKAAVARAAVEAGASIVNDVSGLAHDPAMAPAVAELDVAVVIMHMRGTPRTMGRRAEYGDVVEEVSAELAARVRSAREEGIERGRIVVDPGIGFAKTPEQSLVLIREIHRIMGLGYPVLVGPSRKSFLGAILGSPPGDRLEGTLAACAWAYGGGARLFRVHDVEPAARLLRVLRAIEMGRIPEVREREER
ncbi:MAG: dihydropteroate synthase [Gemmatimonadetes bacterium]|nr:dihydropteroate synthase [Gemmatimonadota bacterium]NIR78605.1 dihydropteroate synthase [Gemmatimonadota bacterium]NIT90150.1 dihydropteroate synthase [Gemmatimonadota bacterium]NIU33982.1 dihydropteroate synthase [Gemmatimonadota bacterium]NIU38150.1 dihydropteroate synthase [Gemmatimonadota bacterium]